MTTQRRPRIVDRKPGELTHLPVNLMQPVFAVTMKDKEVHGPRKPFCSDPSCPCQNDEEAAKRIQEYHESGKITAGAAMLIVVGLLLLPKELALW